MIEKIRTRMIRALNGCVGFTGIEVRRKTPDFYLHNYTSYEHYKSVQVFHNKRKIHQVWADESTLGEVAKRVQKEFPGETGVQGICHGTRNGFEQKVLSEKLSCEVIGTDISDTATSFPRSVQWDFHDRKEDWVGRFHFIYTNSLDQSWKPKMALETWLEQLRPGGILIIEHTPAHGPEGASEMDPFGAKPEYMPWLLSDWFGHRISIEIICGLAKKNIDNIPVWLFVLKKNR